MRYEVNAVMLALRRFLHSRSHFFAARYFCALPKKIVTPKGAQPPAMRNGQCYARRPLSELQRTSPQEKIICEALGARLAPQCVMRRARRAMLTADPILERAAGSPPNTSQVSLQSRFAYTPPRKVLHVWRRFLGNAADNLHGYHG